MGTKTPDPVDIFVGSRIRMQRNIKSMSQEVLGEKLGITFQQVQKYEKGTNRIGASRLQKIADILEVEVGFFFDGAPSENKQSNAMAEKSDAQFYSNFITTQEGIAMVKAYTGIKDHKIRKKFVELMEVYKNT